MDKLDVSESKGINELVIETAERVNEIIGFLKEEKDSELYRTAFDAGQAEGYKTGYCNGYTEGIEHKNTDEDKSYQEGLRKGMEEGNDTQ